MRQGFREKGRAEHRALRVSKGGRREEEEGGSVLNSTVQ